MIDVAVISNHPVRDFGNLSEQKDMEVSKILPTTVDNIVEQIGNNEPDIIVIADSVLGTSRHSLCHFLGKHYNKARILVLTDQQPSYEMLARSGFCARGFISQTQWDLLAKAVRVVFAGESWLPRRLVAEIVGRYLNGSLNNKQIQL